MDFDVTVQIDGDDVRVGRLFTHVRRGVETSTFAYDDAYLARSDAFALEPGLPLIAGTLSSQGSPLFRVFEDCMPDRWGRNLMMREERRRAREESRSQRTLFEGDYLAGVSDVTRQGALRIWAGSEPMAPSPKGVPREVSIPQLLDSSDRAALDMDADVRDLLAAGSSLGGARPKASVRDAQGRLCIAKFPKASENDVDDVSAWEYVVLRIAEHAGIRTPRSRLIRVGGRAVLILERFDRVGERRIPYISGLTAVQGNDGGSYSYLELAEFLESSGARPTEDLQELWKQMLLTCAVGNTDNHLRNYGFLREKRGWRLAPMFDVNPTRGDFDKVLSTALDFDTREADPAAALEVSEYFRLSHEEACSIAFHLADTVSYWRAVARRAGISSRSMGEMESCFEQGVARLKSAAHA